MKAADVDRYCAKAEAAKVCIQYAAYFTLIEFIFNFFQKKKAEDEEKKRKEKAAASSSKK